MHWSTQILVPVVMLGLLALGLAAALGELRVLFALAVLMAGMTVLHAVLALRMHNPSYLVPMAFYLFAAMVLSGIFDRAVVLPLAAAALLVFGAFMYQLATRRLKWFHREVLELSAREVRGAEDGYTPRPYPAGSLQVAPGELESFARFLLRHGVAVPYREGRRLVLAIPRSHLPRLLGIGSKRMEDSCVIVDSDGGLSVSVSRNDYAQYNEELSFDELCSGVAGLFREFLDLHRAGRGNEILRRLRALRFVM
jgi:hypothetical protein